MCQIQVFRTKMCQMTAYSLSFVGDRAFCGQRDRFRGTPIYTGLFLLLFDVEMKSKDLQILRHLRVDARMPLTTMSRKTNIPVSTIFERMKQSDVIVRNTALLDFVRLGYYARAYILLRVDREDRKRLEEYLCRHDRVNNLHKINGFDFLLEGIFEQIGDAEEFLEDLEMRFGISEKRSFFVVNDVKREGFLADPHLLNDSRNLPSGLRPA